MDFEKLIVWQRSKDLAVGIYREFARCGDFGFKDQITRSALSVPSNIAEGMERRNAKEKIYFLWVAKGPAGSCVPKSLLLGILLTSQIRWLKTGLWKPASFLECWAG
jgi:hypothetical protein